ncbi:hypothetical protein V6N13_124009 [Hibiscus sabdariffa]
MFDYMYILRSVDPNGNFELMVERPTLDERPKFRRLYVCFRALKEPFKRYCRPPISLDGCFLKGSFQGEILSAVDRDSNNQIFPIAWAVVEVKNRDTWAYFLNNIQTDLDLDNGEKVTLISDMQKGLLEEVPLCLPNVEHRSCARHMSKCDAVENNFSEAFIVAILGARFKSVISLFDDIRHYVMHKLVEHKRKSLNWKGAGSELVENGISQEFHVPMLCVSYL